MSIDNGRAVTSWILRTISAMNSGGRRPAGTYDDACLPDLFTVHEKLQESLGLPGAVIGGAGHHREAPGAPAVSSLHFYR